MLAAAVDESASPNKRLFALTGVVMDPSDMNRLVGQLEPYATRNDLGQVEVHTTHQNADDRAAVARLIDRDPGLRAVVTVRAAITPGQEEQARQACLTELLPRLHREGVTQVTFDTRDDVYAADNKATPRRDRHDQRTITALRETGHLPDARAFVVHHRASHIHKPLWVADALSWRIRSSIQHDQPGQIAGLAGKLQIVEARHLAHDGQVHSVAPTSMLAMHLQRLDAAASTIAQRDGVGQPAPGNWSDRLRALDRQLHDFESRGAPSRDHFLTEQPPAAGREGPGLSR